MSEKKRQVLPTGLWVVATPIGNLNDMTPRAKQALEEAAVVLCEDTRRTAQLLNALGITATTDRIDAHASEAKLRKIVERMQEGESMALVSDAGTPGVSDPGSALVAMAREAGLVVTPVPGVSAVTALLSASGFEEIGFTFRGFFPRKQGDQEREVDLSLASSVSRVTVWFESPQRIEKSVAIIAARAPEAKLVVAKELTKLHERFFAGSAAEVAVRIREELRAEGERGEWAIAARFPALAEMEQEESSGWKKALQCLQEAGVSASEAAKRVSQHFGIARNAVYARAIEKKD